jgi:hypothetical protein
VIGSRSLSTAIVVSKPGRYTLPAITVQWWDLDSKKMRRATLPAEEIVVATPYGQTAQSQVAPSIIEPQLSDQTNTDELPSNTATTSTQTSNLWVYSTLFFAATSILFALLWHRAKNLAPKTRKSQVRNNTTGTQTLKQALQELHRHCESGLLVGVRKALLDWGRIRWPNNNVQSLNDVQLILKTFDNSETLQALIKQLDASLYGNTDNDFHCADIYREVRALKISDKKQSGGKDNLAPLYKSS